MPRSSPHGAFNFRVNLAEPGGPATLLDGFSEISGLNLEIDASDFRAARPPGKIAPKILPGHKATDLTLRCDLVDAHQYFAGFRSSGESAARRRDHADGRTGCSAPPQEAAPGLAMAALGLSGKSLAVE